jgi:hypothetical protein
MDLAESLLSAAKSQRQRVMVVMRKSYQTRVPHCPIDFTGKRRKASTG